MNYQGDPQELLMAVVEKHAPVIAVAHEGARLGYHFANRHLASAQNMPGAFTLRMRRNTQNDYAVAWVRSLLLPLEDEGLVDWVDEDNTSTMRLPGGLAIRVKKTDDKGHASNASTQRNNRILNSRQQSLFASQGDVLENLSSDLCWFTLGFVPDDFDIELKFCGLALADGPILPLDQMDDHALAHLAPQAWPSIVAAREQLT